MVHPNFGSAAASLTQFFKKQARRDLSVEQGLVVCLLACVSMPQQRRYQATLSFHHPCKPYVGWCADLLWVLSDCVCKSGVEYPVLHLLHPPGPHKHAYLQGENARLGLVSDGGQAPVRNAAGPQWGAGAAGPFSNAVDRRGE